MDVQELIRVVTNSDIYVEEIRKIEIPAGSCVENMKTMHDVWGIVVPISGSAEFSLEGTAYTLTDQHLLFAGPGMTLSKKVIGNSSWLYYLIHYKIKDASKEHLLTKEHFLITLPESQQLNVLDQVQNLEALQMDKTSMNTLKSKMLFLSLLIQIMDGSMSYKWESDIDCIKKTQTYIKEFYHSDISMDELARLAEMDVKRFYYIFKKQVGMSPKQYLIHYRIEKSKGLLLKNNVSVREVAELVGYEDPFHYSRLFKKYVGVSPREFRKRFGKSS